MAPPVVELLRIEHDFGERPVLRGVELRVEPAASLALFGENGAGKTTLLRIVAGLLRPTRARRASTTSPRCRGSGAAPADRLPLAPAARLGWPHGEREHGARCAPVRARDTEAHAALERVGLADLADIRARDLSQGQRQRLGVARALVAGPDLLLLDEPHAGLDAAGSELLDGLIEGLRGSATILLATHDHERGRRLCGSALTLHDGRLAR